MLQILPTDHPAAVVVRASGTVDALQNAGAVGVVRRLARAHGRIGLLLDLVDAETIETAALKLGLAFAAEDRHAVHRLAVLGDGPLADRVETLARGHTRAHVRRFPPSGRDRARAFVCRPLA